MRVARREIMPVAWALKLPEAVIIGL